MNPLDIRKQYRLIHDVYVLMDYGDSLVLKEFDLTSSQLTVLAQLEKIEGCRLTTLSERVLRSKSAITRIIDQLEEKKLVERVDDPEDRRAQRVILTKKGEEFRQRVNKKHLNSLDGRFEVLADDEQKRLMSLLDKLRLGLVQHLELE